MASKKSLDPNWQQKRRKPPEPKFYTKEGLPVWQIDADGNPLLNWLGKPRMRKIGAGEKPHGTVKVPANYPASQLSYAQRAQVDREKVRWGGSEIAQQGRRDLWFLASKILTRVYPDLRAHVHQPMCDFFVHKDPAKPFVIQDFDKNRLLLDARGHFKTTINLIDCMQWLLAFPNITMCLFSGTEELTARMVSEIKAHFLLNGDFRELYPDWVPHARVSEFGERGSFTLPNRTQIRREPSLSITTLKSTRAGGHYDVQKYDDIVHERNSATAKLSQDTQRQWSLTQPLLNPGGYRDLIGTLYSYDCLYMPLLEKKQGWKIMVRGALERKPDRPLFHPQAIRFPERFCVDQNEAPEKLNLQQIWRDDPELFAAQYMNDPQSLASDQFALPRLRAHVTDKRDIPSTVNLYMTWDLAYSTKDHSDYSVGIVGGYSPDGTLFVVDIVRNRYAPAAIIDEIIRQWRKWPIYRMGIEQDLATRMLFPGLEMRQRQLGCHIVTDLIPLKLSGMGPTQQIIALGPLLEQNKLWFSAQCENLEECFRELSRYPKYAHDDIARALSLLLFYRNHGYRPELMPDAEPVYVGGAMTYEDGECGAGIVA